MLSNPFTSVPSSGRPTWVTTSTTSGISLSWVRIFPASDTAASREIVAGAVARIYSDPSLRFGKKSRPNPCRHRPITIINNSALINPNPGIRDSNLPTASKPETIRLIILSKKEWPEVIGARCENAGIKINAPICPPINAATKVIPSGRKILPSIRCRLSIGMNAMSNNNAQRNAGPKTSARTCAVESSSRVFNFLRPRIRASAPKIAVSTIIPKSTAPKEIRFGV